MNKPRAVKQRSTMSHVSSSTAMLQNARSQKSVAQQRLRSQRSKTAHSVMELTMAQHVRLFMSMFVSNWPNSTLKDSAAELKSMNKHAHFAPKCVHSTSKCNDGHAAQQTGGFTSFAVAQLCVHHLLGWFSEEAAKHADQRVLQTQKQNMAGRSKERHDRSFESNESATNGCELDCGRNTPNTHAPHETRSQRACGI